jgi:threonine/homoserine/homoserine lactone efflux protein
MSLETALLAYLAAATLITLTPGLDTALVLRTAAVEGRRRAALAAFGIICGCLAWGASVALGLSVLLAASQLAYEILRWAGAAYLAWLGVNLILKPRASFALATASAPGGAWWARGFFTNLLNPKVGVFYVSFLPQFVPAHVAAGPFMLLLALIHGLLGLAWFAVLISAASPLKRWLQRQAVVRWIDRVAGAVFVGFGLRLALERR